jgi:spermidine synthase
MMDETGMIYFLLGLEGFIGLSYQLLFFRQLTPHVGMSSTITGWIIGVFLGALSLGYKFGGRRRDNPLQAFGFNLVVCALIAGVSLSTPFLYLYFEALPSLIGRMPALIIYCFISIGPVAFLMGQALPLLMQVETFGSSTSEKGGNALFLSTLGSMAGAIIPMTFLAPYTGVTLILSGMLWLAGITGIIFYRKSHQVRAGFFVLALILVQLITVAPHLIFPKGYTTTAHSDIHLLETETERLMMANGLTMSAQDLNGTNASNYIDTFQETLARLSIQNQDVVVLGAGGFMAHRNAPGNNEFIYVDIDPALQDWSEKYFGLKSDGVTTVDNDARSFIIGQPDKSLSVVFMDTYSTAYDAPEHLMTAEYFSLVKSKLQSNGVIIINTLLDPLFRDDFSKRFYNTIQSVFPYCQVHQNNGLSTISNVQFTCVKEDVANGIYRDSKNTIGKDIWETRKIL